METSTLRKRMPMSALADPKIIVPAIGSAFAKLDPRALIKNPVMFVVEIVAALTTVIFIRDLATGGANLGFTFQMLPLRYPRIAPRSVRAPKPGRR